MTRVTFPGRFQPFHEGHYRTVERYRDEYVEFVLVLGSCEKARDPANPLTAGEREAIIRACFPDLEIVELADEDRGEAGYEAWETRLLDASGADVIITGNDLVRRIVREHTDARLVQQQLHSPEQYSGTEIRARIRTGQPWRHLVPDCCEHVVAGYVDVIKASS